MTFSEIIDYVLEMSGNIPKDAKIVMEYYCDSEWGTVYDAANSIRYDSKDNCIVISYK